MTLNLVVLKPFAGFKRGDLISEQQQVEAILAGPQANSVVRVAAPATTAKGG
jgi:hypothetical protein